MTEEQALEELRQAVAELGQAVKEHAQALKVVNISHGARGKLDVVREMMGIYGGVDNVLPSAQGNKALLAQGNGGKARSN